MDGKVLKNKDLDKDLEKDLEKRIEELYQDIKEYDIMDELEFIKLANSYIEVFDSFENSVVYCLDTQNLEALSELLYNYYRG